MRGFGISPWRAFVGGFFTYFVDIDVHGFELIEDHVVGFEVWAQI